MPDINLAPMAGGFGQGSSFGPDYNSQLAEIQRRQKLAELLQQQASQPFDVQSSNGIPAPISPFSVLAKILQTYGSNLNAKKAQEGQAALSQQDQDKAAELVKALTAQKQTLGTQDIPAGQASIPQVQLPGGPAPGPAQSIALPGMAGTPSQQVPQMDDNAKLAALLTARGGPQTEGIRNALLPQILQHQNAQYDNQMQRDNSVWNAQNIPMSLADKQQIAAQGAQAQQTAQADALFTNQLKPSATSQAEIDRANRALAEEHRHNVQTEYAAQHPFGVGFGSGTNGLPLEGQDFVSELAKQNPGLAAQVKAIGTYRQPGVTRTSKEGVAMMNLVNQAYPNYDQTQFTVKNGARKAFAEGAQGKTILAINNAMAHLNLLGQLADALQNGNVQMANAAKQAWLQQTGSSPPTTFDAVRNIAAQEVVKSVVPGGGGEKERDDAAKNFSRASSPPQIHDAINGVRGLFAGQLGNYQRMYKKNTGLDDFGDYLSPDTSALMNSAHAADPATSAIPQGWGVRQK